MRIWQNEKLDWDTFAAFVSNRDSLYLFEQEARYIIIPKEEWFHGEFAELVLYERQFKHTDNLENLSPKELMDHSFFKLGSIMAINPFRSADHRHTYSVVSKTDREITIVFNKVSNGVSSERVYSLEEIKKGRAQAFPSMKSDC